MPEPLIGRPNTMLVKSSHKSGILLDGGALGDILLPKRYVPAELKLGTTIEVFLSLDSEDRPVATTERPLAMVGEFASLKVVDSTQVGAFLDWGMPKDLLLPFSNQVHRLHPGDMVLVRICLDQTSGRLVDTAKLGKFLADTAPSNVNAGDRVSLQIAEQTDLGVKAIVDDLYWGLIPDGSSGKLPAAGERCTGYISRLQEDGLVDLGLEPPGYAKVPAAAEQLAEVLAAAPEGFLPVHDKSPPERIRDLLGMSKKVFKQAVGALYKAGRIRINEDGIHLLNR
jgi:predicted RNA-binding protein (virulence factor B family)